MQQIIGYPARNLKMSVNIASGTLLSTGTVDNSSTIRSKLLSHKNIYVSGAELYFTSVR